MNDRKFMLDLHSAIWRHTVDVYGRKHSFPVAEPPLTDAQRMRAERLIRQNELPCVMHSGPYAELSIVVYDHIMYPGDRPAFLLALSEEHFGLQRGAGTWDARFDFMSRFTHTERNKEVCELYDLPQPLLKRAYAY